MNIVEHPQGNIMEIWLTGAEREDKAVQSHLHTLYETCAARGIQPVVFYSGTKDLTETTSHHLCYNRKRLAERETLQERMAI